MIEESNIYLNQTCLEMNTLKKSKACKIPTLHLAEGKRITKTKLSMIPNNVTLKLKVPQILKETLLKRNNIEKVRKHLKLDIARHQRVEECIYEEKLYTAGEEESKPEDQMMQQPVPNQIYQIEEEVTEKKENPISFPNSLQINEKYSEKMLARFNENEVFLLK